MVCRVEEAVEEEEVVCGADVEEEVERLATVGLELATTIGRGEEVEDVVLEAEELSDETTRKTGLYEKVRFGWNSLSTTSTLSLGIHASWKK